MAPIDIPTTRKECEALDRADPLRRARDQFELPEGLIYLDGHSLGPPNHEALRRIEHAAKSGWAEGLIRSWNSEGWIDLPLAVGAKLARLIGAQPEEVVVTDSVSVNLFKLASAARKLTGTDFVAVEETEFPTDQYIAQGMGAWMRVRSGEALEAIADVPTTLIKSVVNYRTSEIVDIAEYERAAAKAGSAIIWDLSHATGILDLDLPAAGAKLAAGCTYKFVNGGPGAPAFVYVSNAIANKLRSPIAGWFGHAAPFAFDSEYRPRPNAARFAAGTPPIFSLCALDGALEAFKGVSLSELQAKARALGDLCIARANQVGLVSISPADSARRGGHVSLVHAEGYAIVQALILRRVIPDFRAPDAMRFGFSPLYVRFTDVWDAMDQLADVLQTQAWDRAEFKRRAAVT
ncbi:MAG TPA: aminotransferase class V-fold PLP-dependent enzyme [Hyphomonadaceae bacterium]|nr:aminotransferase class V-fold PLP-dependent enzyme [Hyphomonadaceae bacterium]